MTTIVHAEPAPQAEPKIKRSKYVLMNPRHIIKRYEVETGARYCTGCKGMVPLDNFPRPQLYAPRHFICKAHHAPPTPLRPTAGAAPKPNKREVLPYKKAAMALRASASKDKRIFGRDSINLTSEEAHELLTQEHADNPAAFAIVPADPTEHLSKTNAVIVSSSQRSYLTGLWKVNRDAQAYKRDMAALLNVGSPPHAAVI
jgi:hypothetical protein